jgi:hypothetical protein
MTRVILLIERPPHMGSEETAAWLRQELTELARDRGVRRISVSRLEGMSTGRGSADWLVELDCADRESAEHAASSPSFTALYGDLRLIGMRPSVALANQPLEIPDERNG